MININIDIKTNILKQYKEIDDLLTDFFMNDVPFNMSSFIKTLRNISGVNINEKYETAVYYTCEEINDDIIEMNIAFNVNDKSINLSYEMLYISFEAVYIDKKRNDIKIIKFNK